MCVCVRVRSDVCVCDAAVSLWTTRFQGFSRIHVLCVHVCFGAFLEKFGCWSAEVGGTALGPAGGLRGVLLHSNSFKIQQNFNNSCALLFFGWFWMYQEKRLRLTRLRRPLRSLRTWI